MGVSREKYLSYMEKLIRLTHMEPVDREAYLVLVRDICRDYNIAKAVTEFYPTPMMEQRGQGETFCDVDNGKGDKILMRLRIVSSSRAIMIGTLFVEKDEAERDPDEYEQLDALLRIVIGYVSRKRLIRILEEFGFLDAEGYRNYRAFSRYLDIANSENRLGGRIAFHIDLHNFSVVNHEIGRENGNAVIRNYYKMIENAIGDTGIVCRLGGDKFIGIFDRKIKRKIFEIFSGVPVNYDNQGEKRINISAAAGIYMLPNPFMLKSYGDVMDKIMMAAVGAKRQSGGIVIYDDRMKSQKEHMRKVQSEFREALAKEEFAVYYQPKVDIETRQIVGAEALCRWIKGGTIVPPMEFIPVLELNTDICDLDFYMLDHVCRHIRKWLDEGRSVVRVSVNLSRKHLVDVDLLDHIISIIDKYKVPHEYIEIELTETTTDVLFRDLKRVVSGLQEQGIWTAVDDFGVGYSSLNLISEIPWNVLKVDKSFVPRSDEAIDSISNKMFKHVISLANDIGLECVIEGVESIDQLEILRRNNCFIAQGYFFDRPIPLEEFESRLDRKVYPDEYQLTD